MGQDTGGPYTGTVSVNSDNEGSCIDNRGQMIQEGRLFEPGPDECQVRCSEKLDSCLKTIRGLDRVCFSAYFACKTEPWPTDSTKKTGEAIHVVSA